MSKLSILIPVYYNEESLELLYEELTKVEETLKRSSDELELIFIDDGSGDNSFKKMLDIKARRTETKIIRLTRNFGSVAAIKTGLDFVSGDCFMYLAADLQDPPALIVDMFEKWKSGSKYVICVRSDREDPAISKLFSKLYYWLLNLFVLKNYPAGGFDLALMDKQMLKHVNNRNKNTFLPLFIVWLGYEPTVLQYKRNKRLYGHSRWSFSKRLKAAIDAIFGFSYLPIRMITVVGLVISSLSFLFGLWVIINAFLGRTAIAPGYATLAAMIAFLQGICIFMLGILGEYIWRIFDELSCRPESVIEDIY